jgi:hypothetical protein
MRAQMPPRPTKRRTLSAIGLVPVVASALVLIGGGGSIHAQSSSVCPPTFDPPSNDPQFPTGRAVRSGNVEDVRLAVRFGPSCKPSMTATAVRGDAKREVIPFTSATPATARAFRLHAENLCDVTVPRALHVVGRARRGTCEQALLAFYVGPTPSPKEGTAVKANTCQIVGIARAKNRATARARRDTIPVTIEVARIGGTQGLLFVDQIILKISDPSVGTPYVAKPANAAQLKECNTP